MVFCAEEEAKHVARFDIESVMKMLFKFGNFATPSDIDFGSSSNKLFIGVISPDLIESADSSKVTAASIRALFFGASATKTLSGDWAESVETESDWILPSTGTNP